jgi:hypothetical protein
MKPAHFLLLSFNVLWSACGGSSGPPKPGLTAPPGQLPESKLIHSPPVARLSAEQLRSLSMECEKYAPIEAARGPYDAAYCENAIAAWSDAPLQIVPLEK